MRFLCVIIYYPTEDSMCAYCIQWVSSSLIGGGDMIIDTRSAKFLSCAIYTFFILAKNAFGIYQPNAIIRVYGVCVCVFSVVYIAHIVHMGKIMHMAHDGVRWVNVPSALHKPVTTIFQIRHMCIELTWRNFGPKRKESSSSTGMMLQWWLCTSLSTWEHIYTCVCIVMENVRVTSMLCVKYKT